MSIIQDVHFDGQAGQQLAGKLHLPQGSYRGAAIFAHCFTCSKETLAATRIAAGLAAASVAVLRFDFTGLGRSQGAFSDTSFASNLEENKQAGKLDFIDCTITLTGPLDAEMRDRLLQIADKCPVQKSPEPGVKISSSLA